MALNAIVIFFAATVGSCTSTATENAASNPNSGHPNAIADTGSIGGSQETGGIGGNADSQISQTDGGIDGARWFNFKNLIIPPEPPKEVTVIRSQTERAISFPLLDSEREAVSEGNARFAIDIYHRLAAQVNSGDNLILSPHSISVALAMAYAGARGNTAKQMADVLHFSLSQERVHAVFNYLALELATRAEPARSDGYLVTEGDAEGPKDSGFRLNIVNAAWPDFGFQMRSEYIEVLDKYYGSALFPVNYGDYAKARRIINGWVADRTVQRIDNLIPDDRLLDGAVLVLTNAVYFKAAWVNHFDEAKSYQGTFHRSDGIDVTVPMMMQQFDFRYAEGGSWQALEIPYERKELSMVLIVPKASSNLAELEESLNLAYLVSVIDALQIRDTLVRMPKFSFKAAFPLKSPLEELGMTDAFRAADFSGIAGAPGDLYISEVLHDAFIAVDEAGTEAAAATAVIFMTIDGGGKAERAEITLDRPFLFLIRDSVTGAILFLGRVVDPVALSKHAIDS